jgi:hypothetical protein
MSIQKISQNQGLEGRRMTCGEVRGANGNPRPMLTPPFSVSAMGRGFSRARGANFKLTLRRGFQ